MRNLQTQIYEYSPIFIQNIWTSWNGYLKMRIRYKKIYYSYLIELEKRECLNKQQAGKLQGMELQRLLHYAVEKSPFYKKLYKHIDIETINSLEDLKILPVLKKEKLLQCNQEIHTITEREAADFENSFKGGETLKLLLTGEDIQKKKAFLDFFRKQHGAVNLEMKRASFCSNLAIPFNRFNRVYWRDNHFFKQRLYSSCHCTQINAAEYIRDLEKFNPDFIDGKPSAIYELAKFINHNKLILTFKPVAVFSVGEAVQPHYRKEIEEAFECPLRAHYRPSEASPLITECVKGKMHYNLYSGVIETTQDGRMVVTSFNNYGTPLIRYDIGKRGRIIETNTVCECGSIHPVIGEIDTD